MQALSPDLVLDITQKSAYQVHAFSYKGIKICSLYWAPSQYRWHGTRLDCSQCPPQTRCFCCTATTQDLNKLGYDSIGRRIFSYAQQLFQPEYPKFEICITAGYGYALLIANTTLFTWNPWRSEDPWVENSTSKFALFDDRLEVLWEPIVLYKNQPFHLEILNELRKLEPFKSAPTWF